ncbi:MAG: FHA domain-containing protein [Actinomycetota bacterium]|nr:FHA domain-containing protein [Actinomycetota bacterium]
MSELTLTLIRLGFLAVLWLFVLSAVSVIRSDMFGARVEATQKTSKQAASKQAKPVKQRKSSRSDRSAPRQLVVTDGTDSGQSARLGSEPILIGRGPDAGIRLDDDYVSTRHARVATNGEQWFVEDLGSTNGTYVGSQRVTTPTPVAVGTPIRIGKTVLELRR